MTQEFAEGVNVGLVVQFWAVPDPDVSEQAGIPEPGTTVTQVFDPGA
jgi:hypothetical protein